MSSSRAVGCLAALSCAAVGLGLAAPARSEPPRPSFDKLRKDVLQSARATKDEKAAAAVFGDLGEPNGITVKFGDPGQGIASVVHEGQHIIDGQWRVASWNPKTEKFEHDILMAETERRAYRLTAGIAALTGQTLRYEGGTFRPGMPAAQVDQEVARILSKMDPQYLKQRFALAPWEEQ